MTTPRDIYPLSTREGSYIPLDVIDPIGYYELDITTTASGVIDLPATGNYLILARASVNCVIRWDDTAVVAPVSGTLYDDTIYLFANEERVIRPYTRKMSVRAEASGKLRLNYVQQWNGLVTKTSLQRT